MEEIYSKVLTLTSKVPKGRVTTYGEIARKLEISPRVVGKALNRNPHPIEVPCHRVVMSSGEIGGYSLGVKEKVNLLEKEGINIIHGKILKFTRHLFKFY
ncbi:MAG: MGMT family protein [Nanoarchaeota archaeon]